MYNYLYDSIIIIFNSIFIVCYYKQYHFGWKQNKYRSVSYTFGTDVIEKFLMDNNFQLIVRAHQVCYIIS